MRTLLSAAALAALFLWTSCKNDNNQAGGETAAAESRDSIVRGDSVTQIISQRAEKPWFNQDSTMSVLPAEDFEKLIMGKPNTQVVDVRTPDEYAKGHIYRAVNVPFVGADSLFRASANAQLEESREVAVYDDGVTDRAERASKQLRLAGFTKVARLSRGLVGWAEAGRAVWLK